MARRIAILAALVTICSASSSRADECDAVAANLGAQIPQLEVSDRVADKQSVTLNLKHPDAAALSLTCANDDVSATAQFTAKWDAAWPPSRFYDLVATAGSIIASNREPAIRSGAVLCAQRAMTAEGHSAVYDVNGARFECVTTTGVGAATRIRISKLRQTSPQ